MDKATRSCVQMQTRSTLDGADWYTSEALVVPDNTHHFRLPRCSPELNPMEHIWEFLRERYLSHRLHADYGAVLYTLSEAWLKLYS